MATGNIIGTVSYLSPGYMPAASRRDERSDLFPLGVIFYEMPSGFADEARRRSPPSWPSPTRRPASSRARRTCLAAPGCVIETLLVKDREARYASAGELLADLRALADEDMPTPPSGRAAILAASPPHGGWR